jgi:hypothetical protein
MDETGVPAVKTARRWPAETIEAAYLVYAGPGERNAAATTRMLAGVLNPSPPEATVKLWRDRYNWEHRVLAESSVETALGSQRYADLVWVAAPTALNFLLQIVQGKHNMSEDGIQDRIRAAVQLDSTARTLLMKQADLSKADGRRKPVPQQHSTPTPLHSMTDEQLEQEEQRRRQG